MRLFLTSAALIAVIGFHGTAWAQSTVEGRVDRLEREMRAVQRKVFPGGAGQTFEPEIVPQANTTMPGVPASNPVADLTQRVAAVEGQLATLTGQVEQLDYRSRQTEDSFKAYREMTDARIKALEAARATPALAATETAEAEIPAPSTVVPPVTTPTRPSTRPPATTPAEAAPVKPAGNRAAQVAAVEKPQSTDPAENGYVYGFRLWTAKLYPEARTALEEVVARYPTHRRASYAQNLLGRAYLDAGAPSLAAKAFYDNYRKNPNGERAPDSLFYLAQALTKLNKPAAEICKVYTELNDLYGAKISEEMKAGVAEGRMKNKCK